MKRIISVYRITLLLYAGALLLPFAFYYNYQSLLVLKNDISSIAKFTQTNTNIFTYQYLQDDVEKKKLTKSIEENIQTISPWFMSAHTAKFYVGGKSLKKDFTNLKNQWAILKKNPSDTLYFIYSKNLRAMNFILDKMILLKHKQIENFFILHIILSTIFLLLLIYFTRTYIHCQINKASVYDKDTKLFNHNYFESQLTISCAKAARSDQAFSVLSLRIHPQHTDLTKLNKKAKQEVLKRLGDILLMLTRVSDISCRCKENQFSILLTDTELASARILKKRVEEKLHTDETIKKYGVLFNFSTIQCENEPSPEAVLSRIEESFSKD